MHQESTDLFIDISEFLLSGPIYPNSTKVAVVKNKSGEVVGYAELSPTQTNLGIRIHIYEADTDLLRAVETIVNVRKGYMTYTDKERLNDRY